MFGHHYFGSAYFGPHYFGPTGISTDASVQAGGVQSTGAVGSLTPSVAAVVAGVAAVCAVGSVVPTVSVTPLGVQSTGAAGSVALAVDKTLTGVQSTGAVGSVTPKVDTPTITGVQSDGAVGSVIANPKANPAGVQSTGAAGPLAGAVTTGALTGVQSTGAVGSVIANPRATPSGVQSTGAVGTFSFVLSPNISITGVQSTAAVGTLVAQVLKAITGVAATGAVGTVTPGPRAILIGVSSTGAAGILVTSAVVAPTFQGTFDQRDPSEYMLGASGHELFTEQALGLWDRDWHKDGAKFTIVAIIFCPSFAATDYILANAPTDNLTNGYQFAVNASSGTLALKRKNGTISPITINSSVVVVAGAWNFVAVSLDEAGGASGSHFRVGSQVNTFNAANSVHPSGNPTFHATVMGKPDGIGSEPGMRVMMVNAWGRDLSQSETDRLYRRWKTERMPGLI